LPLVRSKLRLLPAAAQAEGVKQPREAPALFPFVPGQALPTTGCANRTKPSVPIQPQHDLHAMQ
jgi:hypothetical protein